MTSINNRVKRTVKVLIKKPTKILLRPLLNRLTEMKAAQDASLARIDELSSEIERLRASSVSDGFEYDVDTIMYYHGGSGNHGCEALVRTIAKACEIDRNRLGVYSYRPNEDTRFNTLDVVKYFKKSDLKADELLDGYREGTVALSIGGDNYCGYPIPQLAKYNRDFHARGVKTALIGCSIEPDNLKHGEIVGDLCQFDLITARETITYEALKKMGINKNLHLIPDSAFLLPKKSTNVKLRAKTVGINVGSMVSNGVGENIVYKNVVKLVKYILEETDYNMVFISHVTQDFNDDYAIMKDIFNRIGDTTGRVRLIGAQYSAMELKDIISQCYALVAARTHCSIAAYSTGVPTLVLGYSVKSRGIAKDIFGTDKDYVKNVHGLKDDDELIGAFKWLDKNCNKIKKELSDTMPAYCRRAKEVKRVYDELRTNVLKEELTDDAVYFRVDGNVVAAKKAKPGKYKKGTLSIITTCYNSEKYLFRYLDSILNQTNHNIQLVIVNDGSTDNTEQILLNYVPVLNAKGVEVVYLKQENRGIGAGYDLAIKYVDGEYFCWCDSDNFYAPEFVEIIQECVAQHPNTKILRHDGYMVPEDEVEDPRIFEKTHFQCFSESAPFPCEKNLFMNAILERNFYFGNTVLSTAGFDDVSDRKIFHARAGQNWQLCLPMFYNFEACHIDDKLFYFLINPNSVSKDVFNGDKSRIHRQLGEYEAILKNVIEEMGPKNKTYLFKLVKQKYITTNLIWAKQNEDDERVKKYETLFDKYVADDNVYQKEVDKIDASVEKYLNEMK